MKRKKRTVRPTKLPETGRVDTSEPLPDWLSEDDLIVEPLEPEALATEPDPDYMTANVEKGIRDLPVWKNLVARVGLAEARRILRCGLLANRLPDTNPEN